MCISWHQNWSIWHRLLQSLPGWQLQTFSHSRPKLLDFQASLSDGWLVSSRMLMIRIHSVTSGDKQVMFWKARMCRRLIKIHFIPDFIPTASSQNGSHTHTAYSSGSMFLPSVVFYQPWERNGPCCHNNLEDRAGGAGELCFMKKFWELEICFILMPRLYTKLSGKMQEASLLTAQGQQHYLNAVYRIQSKSLKTKCCTYNSDLLV